MRMRTLLGEPMLHFLLIGIALFGAYRWMSPGDSGGRRIVVTQGVIDDLATQHVAARGREPLPGRCEARARSRRHCRQASGPPEDRGDRRRGRLDTGADRRGPVRVL